MLWLSRHDLLVSQRVPFAKQFKAQVMKERYLQVSLAIYIHFGFGQIPIILKIKHRLLSKCTAISAGLFILAGSVCCVLLVCHPQVVSVFCTCYPGFPKSLGWCASSRLAQGRIPFLTDFYYSWFLHYSHLPLVCWQGKAKLILQVHFCSTVYRRQIEVTLLLSCSAPNIMGCLLRKKSGEKRWFGDGGFLIKSIQNPVCFSLFNPNGNCWPGRGIFNQPGLGSLAIDSPALILSKQRDI